MNNEEPEAADTFIESGEKSRTSFGREIFLFLKTNKKWWLLPIIIVFVLFGLLVAFSGTAAPFIYSLF